MALIDQRKDPATQQTAAGFPEINSMDTKFNFNAKEVDILKELGKKVSELAHAPEMEKKARLWTEHNDLKTDTPVIFADPENGWNEIIRAKSLVCTDPLARVWEMALRKQIYWAQEIRDDKVLEAVFDVPYIKGASSRRAK